MKNKIIRSLLYVLMVITIFFSLPIISQAADPATPATPANLTVSPASNTVYLKWDKADKATGYRIFRKTTKGWVKYGTTTKTEVTVKGLSSSTKYTFAVRSYNRCECGKITWSEKYVSCNTATNPAKVSKVTVVTGTSKVNWTAVKGASGYTISYKLGNNWKQFAETKDNFGELTGLIRGHQYQLAIRAYIDTDSGRVYSDYTYFTAVIPPNAPKVEVSSPAEGKLKITWSPVWQADGYRVYYKLGNGSYQVYKNFSKPQDIELSGLKGGEYTVAIRAYIKTADGVIFGGYTPVKTTVKAIDPTPNCPHD